MLCYGFGDCDCFNCQDRADSVSAWPRCQLVVGEQYLMRLVADKPVRVLLLTPDELNETTKERRAHVLVLEDNPYVRAGAECRPLAHMLGPLR